jgi:hypothetical protein
MGKHIVSGLVSGFGEVFGVADQRVLTVLHQSKYIEFCVHCVLQFQFANELPALRVDDRRGERGRQVRFSTKVVQGLACLRLGVRRHAADGAEF